MAKRIDILTPEQEAMLAPHAEEWIAKGLKTGETDWDTFDKYMPICYSKAGLKYPTRVVRVQSPLVGGLASSLAEGIWKQRRRGDNSAVGSAVNDVVGAIDSAINNAVIDTVRDAVNAVEGAIDGIVDAVDDAVVDAVSDAVSAVLDAVDSTVDGAVLDAVSAVLDAVDSAVDGAVGDAVDDAIIDAVDSANNSSVNAVGDVGRAVSDAVDNADTMTKTAVKFSIELKNKLKLNISWHYWLGGQFWVGWGWGWRGVAYVDFLINKCGLELTTDLMERAEANRKIAESVSYIWPNSDFVMVCARPKAIHRNQQGLLHNTRGKSIEWPDGWGLYHLNGVSFDEALFERVTSRKMSLADVLKIEDIDQRKQAMRFVNVWDFIKEAKGEEIDTYTKIGAKDGRKIKYWLYEFPADPDLFPKGAKYAIYEDSMVGKAEYHMQGVLMEHNTVAEAFAWKQSDNLYTVTPKQWEELQLDVDFT